ncbi:hypothetical protein [Corynebacterium aquilae]|uniref:Uncharacterized protein n=1 Tax=Corynebacterium aquilae DSM 44791 TaxID=1431546 RepID=A0A1L7CIB0_9CORY|nr:hypothetical protein [Corynebacterium aquilae]APT85545.1 hypothetical protein CAQU_11345 [Corynebacterium aquilae DSM 44791]
MFIIDIVLALLAAIAAPFHFAGEALLQPEYSHVAASDNDKASDKDEFFAKVHQHVFSSVPNKNNCTAPNAGTPALQTAEAPQPVKCAPTTYHPLGSS